MSFDSWAHIVDNANQLLLLPIFAIAIMAWIVAYIGLFRMRRGAPLSGDSVRLQLARTPRSAFVAGAIFGGIITGEFLISDLLTVAAQREINPRLTARIEWVKVDGAEMPDATALVTALRAMHSTIGHHSHDARHYRVVLRTESGYLTLNLGRDSGDPHEYWVFYPGFHATSDNAVGHAFTDALDKY
jgi:hypothetical protein